MKKITIDCFAPDEGRFPDFVLGMGSANIRKKDIDGIIEYLTKCKDLEKISLPYTVCSGVTGNYISLSYKKII